jgi:ribonucleoside-diphosphate reductase beta chain
MSIKSIKKRNFTTTPYDLSKIELAIMKAMKVVGKGSAEEAKMVAEKVNYALLLQLELDSEFVPTVEQIQDKVENELMENHFPEVAKAYIIYRNKRAEQRKSDIFEHRVNLKPYEYPQLYDYVPAIRHSYWIHTEFNFTSDIQDFKSKLSPIEKNAIKNTMLAISQIEVSVKSFWGDLYHRMPKPEIGSVGSTFAESEVRHADAYSHLLEILGLNEEFETLKRKPVIMKRVSYLEKSLRNSKNGNDKEFAESILLFSLFIEHVSLFSVSYNYGIQQA